MGTGVILMGHFFMGNRRSMWLFRDLATSCYLLHLLLFAATDSCFFFSSRRCGTLGSKAMKASALCNAK